MILYGILIAYLFIGCVYWLWMFVGTVRVVRAVPWLARAAYSPPQTWPKLSIVIPACNEAAALESALGSVLEQDYPDLEIILIDDRSTDGTAAIVDRMAMTDPRIRAFHVLQLPENWLGKVHALDYGTLKSSGSWLLFTDADVHMAPGTLRRAIAYALENAADHLAVVPDLGQFAFGRCQPGTLLPDLHGRGASVGRGQSEIRCLHRRGAFNLVRREALNRTAGFDWLRLEVADDMGLGMMLKRSGARCGWPLATVCSGSTGIAPCGKSPTAPKGLSSAARCSLSRVFLLVGVLVAMEWRPLVALASSGIFFARTGNSRDALAGHCDAGCRGGQFHNSCSLVEEPYTARPAFSHCGPCCRRGHAPQWLAGLLSRRDRVARHALSQGTIAGRPPREASVGHLECGDSSPLSPWTAVIYYRFDFHFRVARDSMAGLRGRKIESGNK